MLDNRMYCDGTSGKDHLLMKGGGSLHPATHQTVDDHLHYIYQDGRMVFKSAVTSMANVAVEIMERNGLTAENVSWLVPHQANQRIISATAERMGISSDKFISNVARYGNTTAGTIPICLAELDEENKLHPGSNLVLCSFGAGYTWGGVYVKWQ